MRNSFVVQSKYGKDLNAFDSGLFVSYSDILVDLKNKSVKCDV